VPHAAILNLLQIIESTSLNDEQILTRTQRIRATVLHRSSYLSIPNFVRIHPSDLRMLFSEYDAGFFGQQIATTLDRTRLDFALSRRMTSAGGKTTRITDRRTGIHRFEISVSTAILFGCFHDSDHRPIKVCGTDCADRLAALLRILEHELVHLVELLLWQESSCSRARFQDISRRFFGHLEKSHRLITPRERAAVTFGIRTGVRVRFAFEGRTYHGIVNRVAKRATVLVESTTGELYNDGKSYAKFYVPVELLEVLPT
jgi:hypothetical protein